MSELPLETQTDKPPEVDSIEIEIASPLLRPGLTLRTHATSKDAFDKATRLLALARLINGPTRKGF